METKKIVPAKTYLDMVKACIKAGFRPLPKAIKEAARLWKLQKKQK